MEREDDIKSLIEAFKGYRDLLSPLQNSLHEFMDSYNDINENLKTVNQTFEGDLQGKLNAISKDISMQAVRANELTSKIEQFTKVTNKYSSQMESLINVFESLENKISGIQEIETKAEKQLARLDFVFEEKKKNYNLKELQKTIDVYSENIGEVSKYLNTDVGDRLEENNKNLSSILNETKEFNNRLEEEKTDIKTLIETFNESNKLLREISEKETLNESYIFDILDKWSEDRGVKRKR